MIRWMLFVVIVAPIVYLLTFGLTRNPRELPSVLVGKSAPAFNLEMLDGQRVTLESLRGSPIVINFWATWCGPCLYEHAVLKEARGRYEKEGVKFLGVVYQDKKENVRAFIQERGEPFTVLWDPQSQTAIDFGVGGVPETFFIDAQGVVRKKLAGVLNLDYLKREIEKMRVSSIEQRARAIANQLRCPVCRGIPIAESPSELAQDMMQVIRQKLAEGQTETQVLDYFVDRYGEWILLKPKPKGLNLIVWLLPIFFLAGGGGFLAYKVYRWSPHRKRS